MPVLHLRHHCSPGKENQAQRHGALPRVTHLEVAELGWKPVLTLGPVFFHEQHADFIGVCARVHAYTCVFVCVYVSEITLLLPINKQIALSDLEIQFYFFFQGANLAYCFIARGLLACLDIEVT